MASIISFTFREAVVDVEYGGKGLKKIEHLRGIDHMTLGLSIKDFISEY